ncbi:MAG: SUMF1/EgtB/PvdO family nonheme iron enzyme [Planctomycetota bacterium]|nr:SUMF1/EgtB/PvdO family nonheme iron enzyme [Planctomycetota bacterium]
MRRTTTIAVVAAVLVMAGAAKAQTHAPWPADRNNWNDPALWCTVGDPGNAADTRYPDPPISSFGSVGYTYKIGKFEVTAGQYTAFLNAVAATDTYKLYSSYMWSDQWNQGCKIQRSGASGSYTYSVASDYANRPVNCVCWGDAARFCNWLQNGRPTGAQGLSTTEDGAYYLNGATTDASLLPVTRKANAKYVIPTLDEWYKAAFYKGGSTRAGYWDYPTRSNTVPGRDMADASGNNANYSAAPWTALDSGTYWTTVVGDFQNSAGPYGTFDQGGNVTEWTEGVLSDGSRSVRGGAFGMNSLLMLAKTDAYTTASGDGGENAGFRIAYVPEPASMALLALGGLAVLRHRR